MGQRIDKHKSIISYAEFYPSFQGFDEEISVSFQDGELPTDKVALRVYDKFPCEFQDYCNHLYYSNGKCNCSMGWKKRTGLALPVSA